MKVAKMTLGHNDKRTSAQQLMWVWNKISGFFKCLFSHIRRCRGVYSFLSGALSTLFILWAFIWYGILAYPLPWKVIDPTDPRFDPLAFRLSDYKGNTELRKAVRHIFPKGTDKTYVDKILIETSGATIRKNLGSDKFLEKATDQRYYYTLITIRGILYEYLLFAPHGEFNLVITIVFDENNRLKSLTVI